MPFVTVVFLCLWGRCGFLTVIGVALRRLCVVKVSLFIVDSVVGLVTVARACLSGLGVFLTVIVVCLLRFGVVLVVGVCVFDASVLVFWCSSSEVQSESDVL